jgi:hypothetical protein
VMTTTRNFGVRRFIAALADVENAGRAERCAGAFRVRRFIAALAEVENGGRGERCAGGPRSRAVLKRQ